MAPEGVVGEGREDGNDADFGGGTVATPHAIIDILPCPLYVSIAIHQFSFVDGWLRGWVRRWVS